MPTILNMQKGLEIIGEVKDLGVMYFRAEHNIIYIYVSKRELQEKDIKALLDLDWYYDDDDECFKFFT
ncbi:MAG: hypothetical protein KAW92_13770 [Candidatus Cloacimonetes bacterium]|nr:hypothetical protein [Candidatus Cloacimonadota bacterium]